MKKQIKIFIEILICHLHAQRINWVKTIVFNVMTLPLKEAIKLPVLIYGPCSIGSIAGNINLLSPVHYGMLKIGLSDPIRSRHSKSYINLQGTLEVDDEIVLRRGIHLLIYKDAILKMGKSVFIGDNNTIIVRRLIEFASSVRVGNNNTFMDTDFHYIINTNTREIKNNKKSIYIGENCWIGGWCTIKKGTKLPKGTIVAGPYSMTSKDYTKEIEDFCLIAGSPAKAIVKNVRRVKNSESEGEISQHYRNNTETYVLSPNKNIESFCV